MSVLTGSAIGLLSFWIHWLDVTVRMAPDSEQYLRLTKGEKVPVPFCFRWYWPLFFRVVGGKYAQDAGAWMVLQMGALTLTGHVAYAMWGWPGAVLMCFNPFVRFNVSRPVLIDQLTLAMTLYVASRTDIPYWYLMALCLGTMRETAPIWLALYTVSAWPLIGLAVVPFGLWFRRPTSEDDSPYLQSWRAVQYYKRGAYLDWKKQLAPWGALVLAFPYLNWRGFAALAFAYAPQLIATDGARIYYWAAPILIATLVSLPLPPTVWIVLLAVHIFNPYREV